MTDALAFPLSPDDARSLVRSALALDADPVALRLDRAVLRVPSGAAAPAPGTPCVYAIGAFDGVHVGHGALLERAAADAAERGAPCLAATFDPDPMDVVAPDVPAQRLLSCEDRARHLLALGADGVVSFRFDDALRRTTCEGFCLDVLPSAFPVASIHVGRDFHMGSDRAGDVAAMERLGRAHGFDVRPEELVGALGERVSATRVRRLLAAGELDEARALLGRCHYVRGRVEHGRGEGTSFGFPTANVRCARADRMPADGVYACYAVMGEVAWPAAVNVGAPPTFGGSGEAFLEANLVGFDGDVYGEDMAVVFVRRLRPSRRFDSLDELRETVLSNIAWVRDNLGASGVGVAR